MAGLYRNSIVHSSPSSIGTCCIRSLDDLSCSEFNSLTYQFRHVRELLLSSAEEMYYYYIHLARSSWTLRQNEVHMVRTRTGAMRTERAYTANLSVVVFWLQVQIRIPRSYGTMSRILAELEDPEWNLWGGDGRKQYWATGSRSRRLSRKTHASRWKLRTNEELRMLYTSITITTRMRSVTLTRITGYDAVQCRTTATWERMGKEKGGRKRGEGKIN